MKIKTHKASITMMDGSGSQSLESEKAAVIREMDELLAQLEAGEINPIQFEEKVTELKQRAMEHESKRKNH